MLLSLKGGSSAIGPLPVRALDHGSREKVELHILEDTPLPYSARK
jgi:hypothetical protein